MAFTLPALPYAHNALEPHIDTLTMQIHHGKHHQAYVDNLNKAIAGTPNEAKSLEDLVKSAGTISPAVRNNGGGHWNHTFFWNSIKPKGGGKPTGEIATQIDKDFGSYEEFATQFKQAAVTQFGSGWAWLVYKNAKLHIVKTANAETPITEACEPIIACDVWEHAYYIDYRNKRPDYVTIFIEHMINWDFANLHLNKAKNG